MTSQTLITQTADARLTAQIDYTDDSLTIHYQVMNQTTHDLYLLNQLFEKTEAGVVLTDKNLVYIFADGRQVTVSKAMVAVPANQKVEYVQIPCATKLPPLSGTEETFTIPVPLTLKTPYLRPEAGSATTYKEVYVSIGYFVGHQQTHSYELPVQTPHGPAIRFDPFAYEDQKLLTVGPFRQAVPVYQLK